MTLNQEDCVTALGDIPPRRLLIVTSWRGP